MLNDDDDNDDDLWQKTYLQSPGAFCVHRAYSAHCCDYDKNDVYYFAKFFCYFDIRFRAKGQCSRQPKTKVTITVAQKA